jgi:hypothetical protein
MNPKELMIGTYIFDCVQLQLVEGIEHDGCWCRSINGAVSFFYDYEELHPIPIDEKWLTDFGFDISKGSSTWATKIELDYGMSNEYQIFKNEISIVDYSFIYFSYKFITRVEYIHQLQNLYWCLVGKELELKHNTK